MERSGRRRVAALGLAALVCAGTGGGGGARAGITVEKIADTATVEPGGTKRFKSFYTAAVSDGVVVFDASVPVYYNVVSTGIYMKGAGPLTAIARTGTPAPDGGTALVGLSDPAIHSGAVAFSAAGPETEEVYHWTAAGGLRRVADRSTPVPEGTGNFLYMGGPDVSGSCVAFSAMGGEGEVGIYAETEGVLAKVADRNTPIPGGSGRFTGFYWPAVAGANVVFFGEGEDQQSGIYARVDGVLTRIADRSTPAPGSTGSFLSFRSSVYAAGGMVAFEAVGPDGIISIYTRDASGTMRRMAGLNTPIPGGSGTFTLFENHPVSEEGDVVFAAWGSDGQKGLYYTNGAQVWRIIDLSMPLDGKTLSRARLYAGGWDGENVAFVAEFADGTSGVYLARDVGPQPAARISATQSLRVGGAGGFQVLTCNYGTQAVSVTPWAAAPDTVSRALPAGQWTGLYLFDYATGRFSQALYSFRDGF